MRSISHIKTEEEPGDVSDIETRIISNTMADVVLFVDVLLDEAGVRVFSDKDADTLICSYGPVHSRLLRQTLALSKSDIEDAEKSKIAGYGLFDGARAQTRPNSSRVTSNNDGE